MKSNNQDAANIIWHPQLVTKKDRNQSNGHKSMMIWFTGLSGSGKSTIANALQSELFKRGIQVYVLDGDNLRHGINANLSFSMEDRKENIRRTAEVGKLFVDAGLVVLAALISPVEEERQRARSRFAEDEFLEVYVSCTLQECEKRDPKGLYKKARKGEIPQFTGIHQPYEEPKNPDICIDTTDRTVEQSMQIILPIILEKIAWKEGKQ